MFKPAINWIYLFVILVTFPSNLNAQIDGFKKIRWESEKIAPGLEWKSSHSLLYDSIPQNINILIINLHKRSISISYNPKRNIATSKQASETGALVAVNGGFFNIRSGGSVTYIRTGGRIVEPDTATRWKRVSNMNGAVLIDNKGIVTIDRAMTNSWYDSHLEYPDVLITGPLLVSGKEKRDLPKTNLVNNKHPRTVIGKMGKHKIIIVTLDGRTDQAKGMTLAEVTELMITLNCRDAVNLDGGGSTTMWIAGKPYNGVVNMPCDNGKFDHEGERAVSDILIIK